MPAGLLGQGRRIGLKAAAIAAAAALLSGCPKPVERIEVPVSGWPAYEYFYLAQQTGLDRREGLQISSVQLPDPQAVTNGYLRGQFPVALLSAVEVLDLCNRAPARCPVVVLVLDASEGGDQLFVHRSVPSIEALRGKRVAVTFSTLGPYVLHLALQRHGLSLSDVQTRNIPLERMAQALASREVDAAATYPPFSDAVQHKGQARMLFTSRETPGAILDLLVVDPGFLQRQPELINRLIRVWRQAHDLTKADPTASVAVMAQREGLSSADFVAAQQGLRYFTLPEQLKLLAPGGAVRRNLAKAQAVQVQLGLSPKGGPLPQVSDQAVKAALAP